MGTVFLGYLWQYQNDTCSKLPCKGLLPLAESFTFFPPWLQEMWHSAKLPLFSCFRNAGENKRTPSAPCHFCFQLSFGIQHFCPCGSHCDTLSMGHLKEPAWHVTKAYYHCAPQQCQEVGRQSRLWHIPFTVGNKSLCWLPWSSVRSGPADSRGIHIIIPPLTQYFPVWLQSVQLCPIPIQLGSSPFYLF